MTYWKSMAFTWLLTGVAIALGELIVKTLQHFGYL